jgi:hypothetical protein
MPVATSSPPLADRAARVLPASVAARARRRWPAALVGLTVLVVCVPAGDKDVSASVHVTPADIGTLGIVVAAVLRARTGARLPRSRLWYAVGAVVAALGVSTVVSIDPTGSLAGFVRYVQLFVLVPVAVVLLLRDRVDLALVCGAVLATAAFEGAVGTWQYLSGGGASFAGEDVRAVGTFGALDIMAMASVVGSGLVVAVGLALVLRGRHRVYLLALAACLVAPLLFSFSRGTLIATVAAVVVMLFVASPRLAVRSVVFGLAGAIVAGAMVGGASSGIAARVGSIASSVGRPDASVSDRYDLWHAALAMWQDYPVSGVGLKEFAYYRDAYAPLSLSSGSDVADPSLGFQREPLLSPHNMYLLVLSEQGALGLAALLALLVGLAVLTIRRTVAVRDGAGPPDARRPDGRLISVAAVGIVTRILVDFVSSDIGGPSTVLMSILLGLAVWWAVSPDHAQATGPPR